MTDAGEDTSGDEPEVSISPALAAAWGLQAPRGKGPKPSLSVGRIVNAAIDAAVQDGLAAVSMNRIAGDLGTAAMSLYRHVSGKEELLELMADQALGPPPADLPRPREDWRSGLDRWARAHWERLHQHRWTLNIPVSGPPVSPNNIRWLERALRCMTGTPLDSGEKLAVILAISSYVRGAGTISAQLSAAMERTGRPEAVAGYSQTLRQLTDSERFPALTEVLEDGVFDADEDEPDADFVFGLERILDGIAALIDTISDERRDNGE